MAVVALFDGIVTAHLVSVGELVGVSSPTQLATIVSLDPIWVNFNVNEVDEQRFREEMRKRGFGRIVSVSSSAAREPIPSLLMSNAHRPGLLGAFRTLAQKLAADGITLNTILPGRIATERISQLHGSIEKAQEVARQEIPAGRLGTTEEIAAAAAFLCSERASYITGVALLVDGGLTKSL